MPTAQAVVREPRSQPVQVVAGGVGSDYGVKLEIGAGRLKLSQKRTVSDG